MLPTCQGEFAASIEQAFNLKHDIRGGLEAIVNYSLEERNRVLAELNESLFLYITQMQPNALALLLKLLDCSVQKDNVLQNIMNNRLVDLLDYIGENDEALRCFFDAVEDKVPQCKFSLYSDITKAFYTALDKYPAAISYLLEVIHRLPLQTREDIYAKDHSQNPGSNSEKNAFIGFLERSKYRKVAPIVEKWLAEIAQLSQPAQIRIFTTVKKTEHSSFTLAASYYHSVIPLMLDMINQFPLDARNLIFSHTVQSYETAYLPRTALHLYIKVVKIDQIEAVYKIFFDSIKSLDEHTRDDNFSYNLLKVGSYHPNLLAVLKEIERLDNPTKKKIFFPSVQYNFPNELCEWFAKNTPTALPILFNIIGTLEDVKNQFFSKINLELNLVEAAIEASPKAITSFLS